MENELEGEEQRREGRKTNSVCLRSRMYISPLLNSSLVNKTSQSNLNIIKEKKVVTSQFHSYHII